MFHALFALSFAGAYITAESEHWRLLHVTLGYSLAGLLVFRVLYGLLGPRQAGLGLLWRKLGAAPAWLRSLRTGAPVQWRQNMALPMLTGRVPGSGPSPVQHNRAWLAALLLLAVLAFGAWQWIDSPRGLIPARAIAGAPAEADEHDDDD